MWYYIVYSRTVVFGANVIFALHVVLFQYSC